MLDESAFRQSSIFIVGNINRDIKPAPIHASENLFRDGETGVPFVGETIGGGGANSAFTAANLGAKVAFAGKIGTDGLGTRLEKTLRHHQISAHLAKDPTRATGTSIALPFDNGHRHFLSCLPASRALTLADVDLTPLQSSQHLFRADIWFSDAMLEGGNMQLFASARKSGLDVSIDLNWDPLWGHASADVIQQRKIRVRETLPHVTLVHGNARELMEFAEADNLDQALGRLIDWGAGAAVVHLGEKGAGYFCNQKLIVEPPFPVARRINTAGTGDVLSVCMMLLRRSEASIPDQLRLANRIVSEFIEGRRNFIPPLRD